MREMVLNDASLRARDQDTAIEWLGDVAYGMSRLVQIIGIPVTLRARSHPYEIRCLDDWTLFDAFLELRRRGSHEAFQFLMRLSSKVPLLSDTDEDTVDRFRSCEHESLPREDGAPLVYCAITDGIAVGFPSEPLWDKDQVNVAFMELLPTGQFDEVSEEIDNITRSAHVQPISERHATRVREGLREFRSSSNLWTDRQRAFPNLVFGPEVEAHLSELDPRILSTVVNKLGSIDDAASDWQRVLGPAPPWRSKVTDESNSVKTSSALREARRFRSNDGTRRLFLWHARFGSNGRIHLRFDASSYLIEIGYVGQHLPL